MTKIFVNCRFLSQNITGVQRFATEICLALKELNSDIIFVSPDNIIHGDLAKSLNVTILKKHVGHLWEQISLPKYLNKINKPLLLNLCNTGPIFYKNNAVVVHDICGLTHPEWFSKSFFLYYKYIIPFIVKKAKYLFTVSEFSRSEISKYFNCPLNDIKVINNAVNNRNFGKTKIHTKYNFKKYILAVSSISPRKNFVRIIEAFDNLIDPTIELVVVGESHKNFSKGKMFINNNIKPKIHFLGYVSDDDLELLYSNALVFVYPSLYEGFGIPPLESMKMGCPTIVSNTTSLPEVCKDGAYYITPTNVLEISNAINIINSDKSFRDDLIKKGYDVVGKYSWKESAAQLLSSLK